MTASEPEYLASRMALIAALRALGDHSDAVIIAGAQAVYLRTGALDLGVSPFTTDADLALNPTLLASEPALEAAMQAAGFVLSAEPGTWIAPFQAHNRTYRVPVDLIVPESVAPQGGRRGARLPHHGKRAARKASGLEVALVDHSPMTIDGPTPESTSVIANVAGPAALLVAKAFKIADRLDAKATDRLKDKDASDVFRLMQTCDPSEIATTFDALTTSYVADTAAQGLMLLRDQFGRRGRPGIAAASRALRLGVPEARVTAVCSRFVNELDVHLKADA